MARIETDPVSEHLSLFDELDFDAFNKQDWALFNQLHADDVIVTFPDGHQTHGIQKHDEDMQAMFAWTPDMQVTRHPVKFGAGEWTAAIGTLEGTFTQPMVLPDGRSLPPTGEHFKVPMATLARWREGQITEEHLFWDTAAIMTQIGFGPEELACVNSGRRRS